MPSGSAVTPPTPCQPFYLHLLTLPAALPGVALLTAAAIGAAAWHGGGVTLAEVLGPSIGAFAAIRSAAAGESALAPSVAARLLGRMRSPTATLTARELEVLRLVAEGLSNRQISKRLFLSETTIKTHLVHIYAKLDVDSRAAAVAAATRRGLIRSS